MDAAGARMLANGVSALKGLTAVQLNLAHNQIGNDGVKVFLEKVASLPDL